MCRIHKNLALVAFFVLVFALTACNGDGGAETGTENGNGTDTGATEPDAEDEAAAEPSDGESSDIALLLFSRGFEFMVALDEGATEEAEAAGDNISVLDGQSDSSVQITQIQDQIAAGVEGLVISPANSEEIVPGVEEANAAGVPVVALDAIIAGGEVETYVGFDNVGGGAAGADALAELVGEEGTVLELTGAQGAFHAERRGSGFRDQMESQYPDIEVVTRDADWNADNALSITVDLLTSNPDIAGIFTHNDEMVRGVVTALEQVSMTDIPIVGVDGTPTALERIREGTQAATINQDPFEMGRLAIRSLQQVPAGEADFEDEQLLPPSLVTQENVDDPELWGNQMD